MPSLLPARSFQLATTIGILVAQLVNYGVRNWSEGWRLSLGLAAAPAIILTLGALPTCAPRPGSLTARPYTVCPASGPLPALARTPVCSACLHTHAVPWITRPARCTPPTPSHPALCCAPHPRRRHHPARLPQLSD